MLGLLGIRDTSSPITEVKLEKAPPAGLFEKAWSYVAVLGKIPDALLNTARITRTVIANKADLLEPFKHSMRRSETLYPFTTVDGTTNYIVAHPKVAAAVLAFFRHDPNGMMIDTENTHAFAPVLRALFCDEGTPEEELTESFIFTATPIHAKQYHSLIVSYITNAKDERDSLIFDLIEETLPTWAREASIDGRKASRNFAMKVILGLFFNRRDIETDRLQEALDCIVHRMTNNILRSPPSPAEMAAYQEALALMRTTIELIVAEEDSLSILAELADGTPLQKKSLAFILLFAGVDTTATLINYLLWKLGTDEALQNPERTKEIIQEGLRLHSPGPLVGRYPREPLIVQMKHEDGTMTKQTIHPGEGLVVVPKLAALNPRLFHDPTLFNPSRYTSHPEEARAFSGLTLFGGGPHLCPGRQLALYEVEQLFLRLATDYRIKTNGPDELTSGSLIIRKGASANVTITRKSPA